MAGKGSAGAGGPREAIYGERDGSRGKRKAATRRGHVPAISAGAGTFGSRDVSSRPTPSRLRGRIQKRPDPAAGGVGKGEAVLAGGAETAGSATGDGTAAP